MTPKQEQFTRLYVETGNASEAYRQAYNTDNMEQARAAALAAPTPQSSAAVSATMGKAKMLGLLVDKAEIKAEAEISQVKQEERKCPLTEEERKQVSNAFFNKSYSEITLADITAIVGNDIARIEYAVILIVLDKII